MTCRRISWISFWSQLALAVVSSVVIFFTVGTNTPQVCSPGNPLRGMENPVS